MVLPTASPGIFSAVMVGFGRAVGETMIVLMATGNTPVMDWSIFNGMRTLSANIAVEIPEAPNGGTLYRVLFLAALLLFAHDLRGQHRRPRSSASACARGTRRYDGSTTPAKTAPSRGRVAGVVHRERPRACAC